MVTVIPLLNKKFHGVSNMNPTLLILLVCVASFSIIEASAQVSSESFTLRVRSEPNILFIGGGGEYKSGTEAAIDAAPEKFEDYTFVGWQIDGRWADGNPITVRMDNSHSAIAVYSKDLAGSIIVDTIPRVSEITVDGTIYLPDELPLSFSWLDGSTHILNAPSIIKESPGTRYVFDSWDFGDYVNSPSNSVDLTEPVTVKATWTPQYKLDIKPSIPDYNTFG